MPSLQGPVIRNSATLLGAVCLHWFPSYKFPLEKKQSQLKWVMKPHGV